jgi:hypothetical protein
MCNFAPGECVAIAEDGQVERRLEDWSLPGKWEKIPLVSPELDLGGRPSRRMRKYVFIHVTGIPIGLEVLAVSKLSAALHDLIASNRAVVELNNYLPIAAQRAGARHDQLSPPAIRLVERLGQYFNHSMSRQGGRARTRASGRVPIGVIDSGIVFSSLPNRRSFIAMDYAGPRSTFGTVVENDHDVRGHGTEVCRILDAILPDEVPVVSGRVTASNASLEITVLRVAAAFAHLVADKGPAVVNLSLAPRDDLIICPRCRKGVPVEAFHSLILPFVFRLAGEETLTVMAAGNRGQVSNARHALAETDSLVLVEALDSVGNLASYSNRVDESHAAAARVFGGDETKNWAGVSVFENAPHTYGTSYAAPFVSAAAYAYWADGGAAKFGEPTPGVLDFGSFCKEKLDLEIQFRPSYLAAGERIRIPA